MPRRKRISSPFDPFDDDFDEDTSSQSSKNDHPPIQRNAANARERARMRVLSSAFGRLKTKLPNIPPDTKLSKLDTLRLATMYIKQLKTLVEGGTTTNTENSDFSIATNQTGFFAMQSATQNMTWPFGFHHIQNNNRPNALPCASMDWSQSRSSYSKFNRLDNGAYQQQSNQLSNASHWYRDESLQVVNNSNNCAYYENSQHKPNHDVQHTQQLYHATGQTSIH